MRALALFSSLLLFALATPASAQRPVPRGAPGPGPSSGADPEAPFVAIVGARVLSPLRPALENATVVIQGERILSVAAGGAAPPGAQRIDAQGAVLTPGFVGTQSPIGLVEISLERSTDEERPEAEEADPVRASFSAADAYDPLSSLIPVARMGGVTSALSTPSGGLVSGTSAWVDLRGELPEEALVRSPAALHIDLSEPGVEAAGGARPAALSRLREALEDARYFASHQAAYDRRGAREMRLSRSDLVVLGRALRGELPVVIRVSRSGDILRTLELAVTYGLRLILAGCEEGWVVADRIAAAHVPVIVRPLSNLPERFSSLRSRRDNAAILARARVPLILTTEGAHDLANLRVEAGNAVAAGLSPQLALAGLTLEPARAFGLGDERGDIAPGQIANLVLWNGDPFETRSWATHLFVRGEAIPLRSRQTELLERYRDLRRVRRGRAALRPAGESGEGP